MAGEWEADDLRLVVQEVLQNSERVRFDALPSLPAALLNAWRHWRRVNTRVGSARNVEAHYDLGNRFFELFLDPSLTYSCAVWEDGDDLERAQTELLHRLGTGTYVEPSRMTVSTFMNRWLEEYAEANVGPAAYERYAGAVRNHITPRLGAIPLADVRPEQLVAAMRHWHTAGRIDGRGGLAPASVHSIYKVLHEAFERAVRWRLLVVNPAKAVDPPRITRREFAVLDGPQVRTLCDACRAYRHGPVAHLAVLTGMRRSELLGLSWNAVDLEARRLRVVQSLHRIRGRGFELRHPKTERSRRVVTLSPVALDLLRSVRSADAEAKLNLGPAYRDHGLVFTVTDGGPVDPRGMHRTFKRILTAAGLPDIRFHDLRHTHATILLAQNVHPKIVSERLGHSSVAVTLDTYSHVLPNLQHAVAERLDEWIAAAGVGESQSA